MKTNTAITLIYTLIFLATLAFVQGCMNTTSKERLSVEGDKLSYRAEMAQWSLLSFFESKDVKHSTLLSDTSIGEVSTQSDPNSIESAGGLAGEIIKRVIK